MAQTNEEDMPDIGFTGRFKEMRKHLRLTQEEMSDSLECSLKAIQGYEQGTSLPGGKILMALSKKGININWLLIGVGQLTHDPESSENNRMVLDLEKLRGIHAEMGTLLYKSND